jgi:8-oxo-dGTP diphosphatase
MKTVNEVFGNKVRVRACGLCYQGENILLVKHNLDGEIFWAPPGGGVEFNITIEQTLIREFKEETSLDVVPGKFLFFNEHINPPLHAIELFFAIDSFSGSPITGFDPELPEKNIIEEVAFLNKQEILQLPTSQLHHVLKICNNPIELLHIRGQLK